MSSKEPKQSPQEPPQGGEQAEEPLVHSSMELVVRALQAKVNTPGASISGYNGSRTGQKFHDEERKILG